MMKTFLSLILAGCLLLQSMSGLVTYAGFELNRDYISQVLCVNRAKPQLHCNGKCYLTKKLKESEKQQQTPTGGLQGKFEYFFQPIYSLVVPPSSLKAVRTLQTPYQNTYSLITASGIFHPPSV
jgi:hypothetical protein